MSKVHLKIEASTNGKEGQIRIIDFISMNTTASASKVREIVDDFLEKKISETEIYINSRGGSTIEAVEIANELKRLPNVRIKVGAVAASAATYLMTKFENSAYSNSQFMIHRPQIGTRGDIEQVKADLKSLEITTADYKSAYAVKFGKSEDEIEALFKKGDYWMDSKEAKAIGLLDEIIDEPVAITSTDIDRLVACGHPDPPKATIIETEHTMKNRNQIIAALKLPADASDEQIEQAVKDAQAKADQVDQVTAAQRESLESDAKAFAQKAVADKKITADISDHWEKAYIKDKEGTIAMMSAMPSVNKPSNDFKADGSNASGRDKWTLEDYQEKDPEALAKIMTEEPERFEKLQSDYFGKQ